MTITSNVSVATISGTNANKLFASGFENGVSIDSGVACGESWCQFLHGKDSTGYDWDNKYPGGVLRFQYLIGLDKIMHEYAHSSIVAIIDHNEKQGRALYQEVLKDDPDLHHYTRNQAYVIPNPTTSIFDQAYVRYWVKLQPDFTTVSTWRNMMEWRFGDYRFYLVANKTSPYWQVIADFESNGTYTQHWTESSTAAIPINSWFLLEVFWKLSSGNDGQVKVAINGNKIIEHQGQNRKSDTRKPQYHIFKNYGGSGRRYQYIDDLEIWDNVPCASFPCG